MRLNAIKLAGFKSFVDPTTIRLPGNMMGVVGPNGCGKSNIIDAVRWVMGESSARLLRGESMSDVIFSGSSSRKPVGTATVELQFDNSDGSAGGEYANYGEISVKRQVSRDGQSLYFLNGARCRRRDITDLFLGTGLGPRSYSIIEQGMISRMVDARPEELRGFLEEAAGISKYKERRRETENRIRHTRENLERLTDLREEVSKHIAHLKRQARAAEQYRGLKQQQRQMQAELLAMKLRSLSEAHDKRKTRLQERETALQKCTAQLRTTEAELEKLRVAQQAANDHTSAVQGELYQVGSEIARIEQVIAHQQQMTKRLGDEQAEALAQIAHIQQQVEQDTVRRDQLKSDAGNYKADLAALTEQRSKAAAEVESADQAWQQWQQKFNEHQVKSSDSVRRSEVEKTKIEHLDRRMREASERLQALDREIASIDLNVERKASEQVKGELAAAVARNDALEAKLKAAAEDLEAKRAEHERLRGEVDQLASAQREKRGALASLEALQASALEDDADQQTAWLQKQGIDDSRRLARLVEVDAGWETAVEVVLGPLLSAFAVKDVDAEALALDDLNSSLALIGEQSRKPNSDTLAAHVRGNLAIDGVLGSVRTANSLQQAKSMLPSLAPHESVITQKGEWLGSGWLRIDRSSDPQRGALAREAEIGRLRTELSHLDKQRAALTGELETVVEQGRTAREAWEQAQRQVNVQQRELGEIGGKVSSADSRLLQLTERRSKLQAERETLASAQSEAEQQLKASRGQLQQALDAAAEHDKVGTELGGQRDALRQRVNEARQAFGGLADRSGEVALKLESATATLQSLNDGLARLADQLQQRRRRSEEITAQLAAEQQPAEQKAELEQLIGKRLQIEHRATEARKALSEHVEALRETDEKRRLQEREVQTQRDAMQSVRLEIEGENVRMQTVQEQLDDIGGDADALLKELASEATAALWEQRLEKLSVKIHRMEPVNLAAIDEFDKESERKNYLDSQNDDLEQALETLEAAMRKIDRSTRTRFKETFEQVNTGLKELFPKVFGGGHAYLEMTGDDLLTTGVSVLARPPGKRVSSIQLLSGGEKALTAVALVFAIFRLNPAPFCMLDEVDAPLDDANVGRFSELVKEMSETVQFLFVTHNKITMEAAHQLTGVTMREAGVSRLVTVDIAEAQRWADAG
ncbi:MAG: chromosome partition protein Smc [Lysobacteraceae bacterium]|nr:MAG: chromosome partition protein Smc [Xanthomonadaceae bacterium]